MKKKKIIKQRMICHLRTDGKKSSVIVIMYSINNRGEHIDLDDGVISEFPLSWRIVNDSEIHFFVGGKMLGPIFQKDANTYLENAIAVTDQLRSVLCRFAFELKSELNWVTPVTNRVVTDVDTETNGWTDHLISIVKMVLSDIDKTANRKVDDLPK